MLITDEVSGLGARRAARIAGWGYIAIFVLAIFANFFVHGGLIEPDDAAATAANIVDAELLFRGGLVSFLIVFVLDVVIAWALYAFFRRDDRDVALLTAWFRLVYTILLGVALISSFVVLELVSGAPHLAAFDAGQIDAQVMLFLDAFDAAWLIGLACFGIHLMLLGYLALRSSVPTTLGVLLIVAGVAYVGDTLAHAMLPNYDDLAAVFLAIVVVPSVIGELAFAIWLLRRGGRDEPPSLVSRSAPRGAEPAVP
jgi:hypothetical protein